MLSIGLLAVLSVILYIILTSYKLTFILQAFWVISTVFLIGKFLFSRFRFTESEALWVDELKVFAYNTSSLNSSHSGADNVVQIISGPVKLVI